MTSRVPTKEKAEPSGALLVKGWGATPHRGVAPAVLLTSAALLALEVSLTRFFSFTVWYHFAYLTISMALLGFGSSGAIVAAFPEILARRGERFLVATLTLAAILTITGLVFLAQLPIEIDNAVRKPLHFSLSMLVYYVVVGAPFLLAGFSISVPFAAYPASMGRLYFWDLVGAALGCGLVVALIETVTIPGLIFGAAGMLLLAAAVLSYRPGTRGGAALAAAGIAVLVLAAPAGHRLPISVAGTKNIAIQLAESAPDNPAGERSDIFSKWTAINRVDAFGWAKPSRLSYWSALGLRHGWEGLRPLVAHITYDGANGSDIYSFHGDIDGEFRMLEDHQLRLPYLLLDRPNVLAIGVGGGIDLFNAIKQGARHVTGAELQPETVRLLSERLTDFTGNFYHRDDVTLVASEGRHFVRKSDETFDLVQITAVDTFAAQAAGAYVLAESYLYTVEAMEDYFRRLTPAGIVTIVVGDIPFVGELAPLATRSALIGYRALQRAGVADPGRNILVVGSSAEGSYSQDASILIKKTPFTDAEVGTVRSFVERNGFRLLYAPGPGQYEMSAVLGTDESVRQRLLDQAPFRMEATYDANPFYYNIAKWRNFSHAKSVVGSSPGSYIGQLVLVLMVAQSVALGLVLIVGPLLRGARAGLRAPSLLASLTYFLCIGVGFMFIEISFVQTFVLFLGSPAYALSVTIFALLLFSGIGSYLSTRFQPNVLATLRALSMLVAVLVLTYSFGLASVFDTALHMDIASRIAIAFLALLPIGLTLGMFMPLGIASLARENARLVPWAWGINGVGSVLGTTLAVLLAMSFGFHVVACVAAFLYLAGTAVFVREHRGEARP